MRIDLHAHTNASDGRSAPAALVAEARGAGLDVVAVTDHDTVAGVEEALRAAAGTALRVVPGIEITTAFADVRHLHVLGFFVDQSAPLRDWLESLRFERLERGRRIVGVLNDLGYPITFSDVLAQAGEAVVARPHVARALVEAGLVPDVGSAFSPGLLGDGGPADVPRALPDPALAIGMVREAGGVATLAHPGLLGRGAEPAGEDVVAGLAAEGLRGLEVDHPSHEPGTRDSLRELCARLDLVPTGGSDYHGPWEPGTGGLGSCTTSDESFARLEEQAGVRSR